MKKSLIALAALAFVSAASAQSTVTLYGLVDAYAGQTSSGVGSANVSNTVVNGGGLSTSRFGFKGTEDLGGGLKAYFALESGIASDTGAEVAGFTRKSIVGLSNALGSVEIGGANATSYDDVVGGTNHLGNTNAALTSTVWTLNGAKYDSRFDNSVKLNTAKMSGFSASLQYGAGETKTTTVAATKDTSMNVMYSNGPLVVGLGYQTEEDTTATTSLDSTVFGATYNFGMAKVVGAYNTMKRGVLKSKGYQFGVDVPVSTATTVSVGYVTNESESSGVTTLNASGFALQGIYALSKRTNLYAVYRKEKADNTTVDTIDNKTIGFGVRHTF